MSASPAELERALGLLPAADQALVGQIVSTIAGISERLGECVTAIGLLNRVDTMRGEQIATLADQVRLLTDGEGATPEATAATRAYWTELAELRQQRASQKAAAALESLSDSELVEEWELARARRDALRAAPPTDELAEAERYASQITSAIVHRAVANDDERRLAEGDDQRDYAEERANAELLRDGDAPEPEEPAEPERLYDVVRISELDATVEETYFELADAIADATKRCEASEGARSYEVWSDIPGTREGVEVLWSDGQAL